MAVRGFNDRREPEVVQKGELRSKAALEAHVLHDHGNNLPDSGKGAGDTPHAWLKWHHDLMHESEFDLHNVPHEH